MILSSACQRQADPFPALSGRHGERRSYTTPWDTILYENSDTDEREILEHWIVSDWLAKKLLEQGETVDEDFADLAIWGRKTHGQAIELDDVMQDICDAINRR